MGAGSGEQRTQMNRFAFHRRLAGLMLASLAALLAAGCVEARAAPPVYDYEIVKVYPHDPHAFTQGLFYRDGYLYESTGLNGASSVRKVRLDTGEVVRERTLDSKYFGEGIVDWGDRLIELTWKSGKGFVYGLDDFAPRTEFSYSGEGWGLTRSDAHIVMSDGTSELRFLDPETLKETGRIAVTLNGRTIRDLNELEWVKGEIYANVWQTDWIVRIDPGTGEITGLIDMSGLLTDEDRKVSRTDVLNGIAYDAEHDRLFVTGKNWPKLFEIRLKERTPE